MAYVIEALVAKRSVLEHLADSSFIVNLDYDSFALLPLREDVVSKNTALFEIKKAAGEYWGIFNESAPHKSPPNKAIPLLQKFVKGLDALYIFSELHGGDGISYSVAFKGKTLKKFFDNPWPDSALSKGLKELGIPEDLKNKKDAFDMVGLGRHRFTDDWV
jgi:hypothetical protein